LRGEFALRLRQGLRLDQQTFSLVAAPAPAEGTTTACLGAFRPDPAREQRIPGAEKLEIGETDTLQARRPGFSIMRRSPVPPQRWHVHVVFNGWITTSSGARLAFSAKRSRFFF
jgi:hypothetical protein